jgi:hypothetical protein
MICSSVVASPPDQAAATGEAQLAALERQWNEAYKNKDRTALDRILAPEFVFTDDEGHFTKAEYIEAAVRHVTVGSYQLTDMAFHIHDTDGVVTGLWKGTFSIDGVDASGALRFTDTFTKSSGTWLVLTSHESRAPKQTIRRTGLSCGVDGVGNTARSDIWSCGGRRLTRLLSSGFRGTPNPVLDCKWSRRLAGRSSSARHRHKQLTISHLGDLIPDQEGINLVGS